jgi:hypothetical protein
MNNSSQRKIQGRVEHYNGSTITLLNTFLSDDKLQEIGITRPGEHGKFFGFGISQKVVVKVIDKSNSLVFNKGDLLRIAFSVDTGDFERVCPVFFVKEATRDEKTSVYTVTAYDALDDATAHVFDEIGMIPPYTIKNVAEACVGLLGLFDVIADDDAFNTLYENGANFGGQESIRTVLNAIAEATQTIYFVNNFNELVFKRLSNSDSPIVEIPKRDYFELTTALPATISNIVSVTELGDNVGTVDGVVQYVRDNPFWTNRTDLGTLLTAANNRIAGLTIVPYNIKWRGNFLTEICDKITLIDKYGNPVDTFILDDSISYTGGLSQTCSWEYNPDNNRSTAANPITLGDKLNQTFAKVDKVNNKIDLVASESTNNSEAISALQVSTSDITASVTSIESNVNASIDGFNEDISSLRKEVQTKITDEDLTIAIRSELANGVNSVITETGYTFDGNGLHIAKEGEEMQNSLDNTGMYVKRGSEDILTANNDGVKALNVVVKTWLVIGKNSRFEDYGSDRTGCFWIGG